MRRDGYGPGPVDMVQWPMALATSQPERDSYRSAESCVPQLIVLGSRNQPDGPDSESDTPFRSDGPSEGLCATRTEVVGVQVRAVDQDHRDHRDHRDAGKRKRGDVDFDLHICVCVCVPATARALSGSIQQTVNIEFRSQREILEEQYVFGRRRSFADVTFTYGHETRDSTGHSSNSDKNTHI
jgi:hypothetical protein